MGRGEACWRTWSSRLISRATTCTCATNSLMTPPLDISLLRQHAALPKQILHGWQNTDSCWPVQNFNPMWQNTDFVQNFHLRNCEAHFKITAMTSALCNCAKAWTERKRKRERCCRCWGHNVFYKTHVILWCRIQPSERHVPDPVKESRRWWPSPAGGWVVSGTLLLEVI